MPSKKTYETTGWFSLKPKQKLLETAGIGQAEMLAGDVFEIHTPGGGGFGTR